MMSYQLLKDINLLKNRKLIIWLNLASLLLFFVLLILGVLYAEKLTYSFDLVAMLFFLLVLFLILISHELLHGLFFKLFKSDAKVTFGFKNGMAYAASPGSIYKRSHFLIICIAPFITITFGIFIASLFDVINGSFLYVLFMMHTAGCIGDFYFCYLLLTTDKDIYVEDTATGIKLYRNKEPH